MQDDDDTTMDEHERELARRGEALISAATADTYAPQSLREKLERDRERAVRTPAPFWRRRWRAVAAGGAALAVAAVAVTLALSAGSDPAAEPKLADVGALAAGRAADPPPPTLGGQPPVLDANVGALDFPDWEQAFDWRATGARTDEVGGRTVTTVFYRNPKGARLGYSVVDGEPLAERPAGTVVSRGGQPYRVQRRGGRTVVTWTQQGHTCVIVAQASVPASKLVDLAASRAS